MKSVTVKAKFIFEVEDSEDNVVKVLDKLISAIRVKHYGYKYSSFQLGEVKEIDNGTD